jgi:hypothetical protein
VLSVPLALGRKPPRPRRPGVFSLIMEDRGFDIVAEGECIRRMTDGPGSRRTVSVVALAGGLAFALTACESRDDPASSITEPTVGARAESVPATTRPPESRCDCEPVTTCRVVAEHAVRSAWARERGFRLAGGALTWGGERMLRTSRASIAEVTADCWLMLDQIVVADGRVHVWQPASVGMGGGPGYGLIELEGLSARSFAPIGHGFLRDGERVRSWWAGEIAADRASFEALDCEDSREPVALARDRDGCFVEDGEGRIVRAAL